MATGLQARQKLRERVPQENGNGNGAEAAASPGGAEGAKARIQRALKLSQLFERTTRVTRDAAVAAATLEVVPGGTLIFRQGAPIDALVILGRGRARIERTAADGKVVPLGYRGSGDVLGEALFGRSKIAGENTSAMEEAELVRLPVATVEGFAATDPALASAVVGLLLTRQRETEERIESLLFRNVEGRLVEFLLKAADRWGVPTPKGTLISAPITHLEIAQSIGSTRETVTLTLGALRREGLLEVAGRRLIVTDREKLMARQ
jgi:CRP/FNR family transcriptional regulator, cyclic AMP receptor protein